MARAARITGHPAVSQGGAACRNRRETEGGGLAEAAMRVGKARNIKGGNDPCFDMVKNSHC